jgi:hypothetical protein
MNFTCHRQRVSGIALIGLTLCAAVHACNVPVFRFALERWRADAYRVTLVHRGPLSDAQKEIIRRLEEHQDHGISNLMIQSVDTDEIAKATENNSTPLSGFRDQVWSRLEAGEARLFVHYPEHLRIEIPVWSGPLSRETVAQLTDSPVRRELVRRLAEGQTAVWLLLESGQAQKDNAAAEMLSAELGRLEQELKLPELTSDPSDELLASTPLKVAFSVLRVPHGTAEEQALAGMLIHCEEDLTGRSDPIVFSVFGRGRALLPLIGAGIAAKNIEDVAAFLVGPCSCQVKELNPGFDLLLSVDWDTRLSQGGQQLTAIQTRGLPPLALSSTKAELVPIPSGSRGVEPVATESSDTAVPASGVSWLLTAGLLAGAVAIVVLLAALNSERTH